MVTQTAPKDTLVNEYPLYHAEGITAWMAITSTKKTQWI